MKAAERDPRKYSGHMTMADGRHVALTSEEAEALWKSAEDARAKRAADMPTEQDALRVLTDAVHRLKELGWSDAIYCPKDGTLFDAIEAGSSGIHDCYYEGKWPDGSWWMPDEQDTWPSRPILYRIKRGDQKEAEG